jgi:hypothetical protein
VEIVHIVDNCCQLSTIVNKKQPDDLFMYISLIQIISLIGNNC